MSLEFLQYPRLQAQKAADLASEHLPPQVHQALTSPLAVTAFKILLLLKVLHSLNASLNKWAQNNWRSVGKFRPERELVLITGGSSGIGKQIVLDLVQRTPALRIVILDIQKPVYELPSNTYFYQTDITSRTALKETADKVRSEHGHPTILINNAGVVFDGTILDEPEPQIRKTFEVNTLAHYWTVKEFVPDMVAKDHGHVITVASMASFISLGEMAAYGGTKASALTFHEVFRQELKYWHNAPSIRTSIIHPLWVRTPLITMLTDTGKIFRQPVLEPEDISQAVVKQIVNQNSGQVVIPGRLSFYSAVRALPNWIQEAARGFGSKIIKDVRDFHVKNM